MQEQTNLWKLVAIIIAIIIAVALIVIYFPAIKYYAKCAKSYLQQWKAEVKASYAAKQ